ncbi:hypothetical protein [Symmachiella dynata]|uniref:hypothetical protein n=1 Tax=Symmachiella dynata TaxID=2527995 RepID=UPI0030EF39BD|tara:strand:- start:418 stop:822 length:405 start_codon:yes stop_codon:yes gene_type:complete
MNNLAIRITHILILSTSCVFLSGCQKTYTYTISGIVKDATDGKPLQDVEVDLNGYHSHMGGVHFPIKTDALGHFQFDWKVSDGEFHGPTDMPKWVLNLKKNGYADESVDISTKREPSQASTPVSIIVVVQLRPE